MFQLFKIWSEINLTKEVLNMKVIRNFVHVNNINLT